METKLVRLRAMEHVHIGMQEDGTVLHFTEKGVEKTVVMTQRIEFFIEHKMLEKIEGREIEARLKESELFYNYGFYRMIWIDNLMFRFDTFKNFMEKVQYDDIAILPGTTKQFSEDMMFKIRPPKEEPKKTKEQIEEERKKALEEADRQTEREAEEKRVNEIQTKSEKKRLSKVAKEQAETDKKKMEKRNNQPTF